MDLESNVLEPFLVLDDAHGEWEDYSLDSVRADGLDRSLLRNFNHLNFADLFDFTTEVGFLDNLSKSSSSSSLMLSLSSCSSSVATAKSEVAAAGGGTVKQTM
jgi:hypothetical protein